MIGISHRYLTHDLPGIGGSIREHLEDFVVEEVPLALPCGEGEHVYFEIEKRDLSTLEALRALARHFGRDSREFGYAGLKDRKGITRQMLSLDGVAPEDVLAAEVPRIHVLGAARHRRKLRVGQLAGNRFSISVRGTCPETPLRLVPLLERIQELGIPNYFGPQRFGNRGDAQWIGKAYLRRDFRGAVRRILGCPAPTEGNPHIVAARYLFLQYRWNESLERFPGSYREERRLLGYLLRAGELYDRAIKVLRREYIRLYCSALQSYLFNAVLERRLERTGDPGQLLPGDVASLHPGGAVFPVEDIEREAPRARRFEISPSGPIFGKRTLHPTGVAAELEAEALGDQGLSAADFHELAQRCHLEGGRRPLRVRVDELEWSYDGAGCLTLKFFLPKGSYATTFLRELMKNDEVPVEYLEEGAVP